MVFSIDCAASIYGNDACDLEQALKLSGLKKSEYGRKKQIFETLLEIAKKLTLSEICAQLALNDVIKNDAEQLLKAYSRKKQLCSSDIDSPHNLSMAIYQCCKRKKMKITKIKSQLGSISRLDSGQWKKFEEEWDKWIEQEQPFESKIITSKDVEMAENEENRKKF